MVNSLTKNLNRKFQKPNKDEARILAFEIFRDVIRDDKYSNLLLNQRLKEGNLDVRDKAFVTELVYGSIRQIGRNDYIASNFSSKPWMQLDPEIVDILRIGAYQLFDMRIPTHAAVSATVDLARVTIGESKASYVNALMRRMSEKSLDEHLIKVSDDSIESLSIRYSHPIWIINAYRDHFNDIDELKLVLEANNRPVRPTFVTWPGKSIPSDLLVFGGELTKYSRFGVVSTKESPIPGDIGLIAERKAGVQDEGSQLVAQIFADFAKKDEPWLDLCAGPGGKAALLSYLATEKFYANEISPSRAALVRQVIKEGSEVFETDGREISNTLNEKHLHIKAVLADVPCTGLGAIRRRPEVRWRRKPEDLAALTSLQYSLIEEAVSILPSGGLLGYATCSPHILETLGQCADIERKLPVEKVEIESFMPKDLSNGTVNGYMQLWPHRHQTDAMFLALYRKR